MDSGHTPSLDIHAIDHEDLPACAAFMSEQDPWLRLGIDTARCLASICGTHLTRYGLYIDGHITGLAVVHPTGFASSPYLAVLALDRRHTGQGLGRRLLDHVEATVFQYRKNLFVCVSSFNHRAQHFYLARGYVQIGCIADYLIPGCDELMLRKIRPLLTDHPTA